MAPGCCLSNSGDGSLRTELPWILCLVSVPCEAIQRPGWQESRRTSIFGQDSAFEIPWAPVTCTRVETWNSHRGQDCEN